MEHHNTSLTSDTTSQVQIPTAVWVILAVVVAALIAIFVFKVAVGTVVTYGFLSLMLLSHLFMHGGHGSHGAHTNKANSQVGDNSTTDQDNTHAGHGGCH
jgi:high-affinity Fe2+/Pb2+ permease